MAGITEAMAQVCIHTGLANGYQERTLSAFKALLVWYCGAWVIGQSTFWNDYHSVSMYVIAARSNIETYKSCTYMASLQAWQAPAFS
jgi:hypothetical protein